jgi:class 3 adenylate cyclase
MALGISAKIDGMTAASDSISAVKQGATPWFHKLGVRWRLLLAFFGISAFALLSALASIYAFSKVGDELKTISQDRMPAALVSQEISQQAERIVAAAPALLTLTSITEQNRFSKKLSNDIERLNQLLSELKGKLHEGTELESIENSVQFLSINLVSIDTAVFENASTIEQKKLLLSGMFDFYNETRLLLTPAQLEMEELIVDLEEQIEDADIDATGRSDFQMQLSSLTRVNVNLLKSRLELLLVKNSLLEIASTKSGKELQTTAISVGWSIDTLEELAKAFDEELRNNVISRLVRFRKLLNADDGILATRRRELKGIQSVSELLTKNVEMSEVLTSAVAALVTRLRQEVTAANLEALAIQRLSINVLLTIVALSLISSILIVWLYVGRSLIRRLTGLSDSMLAIGRGDLYAPLPTTDGNDEISLMAEALTVFRDTAIEVEEKNLREIEGTRRRLVDAIESTSEGFAFYDAQDRLELCNSRYRELLYPGTDVAIEPGMKFEEIIRGAAEAGLIAAAEGRVDEWVEERSARHRDPGEPQLQQRGDDRWILISERKTASNGIVAVYADITDLKQREAELAEKSNALEQLSNQLAKYLSPQIYDSIFSGKQEVKLVSERKRLTVFFSDLVGFTETTERLESEDLTRLLNHYLTEMSQIAIAHGATIDKYVGDAIVIFFGDPETLGVKEDALACVTMAIAMRKRLKELESVWMESGLEKPLRCRMGISTGVCTVGNFGSEDRMDYTIIGGGVNLAARLETACPANEILISFETYAHVKDRIECQEEDQIEVKGISHPVTTHRVIDLYENLGDGKQPIRAKMPHMNLDVDVNLMTAKEKREATAALLEAVERLSNTGAKP